MMVFIWQALIILAIVLASVIFGRRGLVASLVVTGVWTVVMIFTSWLMILQFLTIGVAGIIGAAICDKSKTTTEFHEGNWGTLVKTVSLLLGLAVFGGAFLFYQLESAHFRKFDSGAFGMAMGYGLALLVAAIVGGAIIWLIGGMGWRTWSVDTFRIGGGIAAVALGLAVLYGDRIFQERVMTGLGQQETPINPTAQTYNRNSTENIPPTMARQLTGTLRKISETETIVIGFRDSSIPFSYLDDRQQPIGYAMDLCMRVVDAVRADLKMPNLKINLQPVTSSNRIPLLQNGTIDLECGETTNSIQRQQLVSFGPTYFVVSITAAVKKRSGIQSIPDLAGKTIDTTSGTSAIPLLRTYAPTRNSYFNEIYGKSHSDSFLLMANGRSAAFIMDDILLAGEIANSANPGDYKILPDSLRQEPYAMMLRKDDPQFKALVDKTIGAVMKSGEIERIYAKWFTSPIPPKGIDLDFPMTPPTRWAISNPNDRGV